jgi:F-box domain
MENLPVECKSMIVNSLSAEDKFNISLVSNEFNNVIKYICSSEYVRIKEFSDLQ